MESMTANWSYPGLIESLQRLVFFERATSHVLAGWIPKVPGFRLKLGMARHLWESMNRACKLREALMAMGPCEPGLLVVPESWRSTIRTIDASPSPERVLSALYFLLRPRLIKEYESVLRHADDLLDEQLVCSISSYLPLAQAQLDWAREILRPCPQDDISYFSNLIGAVWNASFSLESVVPLGEAIPGPQDRVPCAIRPNGLDRGEHGAMPLITSDSLQDPGGIGIFLHNNINEEYTTLELVARNSYEHPDLPWAFHLSMARQAADEARHALILERLAAEYDVQYGQYPVYTSTYDMLYEFATCPQGSKRELIWRLLIRSTYQEGLALDDLAYEIKKRRSLNQVNLARSFNYILKDELFHVKSGLKWSKFLCDEAGMDAMSERNLARDYFVSLENHARLQFMVTHPDAAYAEAEQLKKIQKSYALPFRRQLEVKLRKEAGFSDDEVRQVMEWGIYSSEPTSTPAQF